MDSERWEEVERLFAEAMQLPRHDREGFLREVCVDDPALYTEVVSLLGSAESHGFADRLSETWLTELVAQTTAQLKTPRDVGPYRIVRELGQGGMGAVFLAERSDPQFKQQVALKLIRPGMVSEEVVTRFLGERQILARLSHRNIARLLDGGVTESGQPFFAMEYVVGTPIDAYADEHTLDIDQRLQLFQQVCAAVHYAHRNLVVHRDIKPSNILVTAEGSVKLLDFGIAKLLDPLDDQGGGLTQTGRRLMTPEYASPEQARGEPISTSSDVYSLGVLLHRLLCGRKPYRIPSSAPREIERVICEQDPVRPSAALDGAEAHDDLSIEEVAHRRNTQERVLRRRLLGDLDTIVLKALQKDPSRRYDSAGQFLDDIDRHLNKLPVHARPDTIVYRVSRFARRHRVIVTSAAIVLLSLIAGLTGTAWQAVRAANEAQRAAGERDRARHESAKAERVSSFLIDLFSVADPAQAQGDTITVRQLLDIGAARLDDYLGEQPESRATMMDAVGRIYQSLGLYDRATALLAEALALRKGLYDDDNEDLAESIDHMGVLRYEVGELREADSLLSLALEMRRRLLPDPHESLAESLDNLGQLRHDSGDLDGADTLYRAALEMREVLLGPADESIATSLNNLAVLMHDRREFSEAESLYRRALEMDRAVLGRRHPGLAIDLNNLGRLLYDKGELDAATDIFEEALVLRRSVLGINHPDVATSANNLAAALHESGDLEGAEKLYREALAIREKAFGRDHPRVATSLNNVATILEDRGDLDGAIEMYSEALEIRRRLYGNVHPGVAVNLQNLASAFSRKGNVRRAERLLREAHSVSEAVFGGDHPFVAFGLEQLAAVLLREGAVDSAEVHVRRALKIRQRFWPEGHSSIAATRSLLGEALARQHRFEEAESLLLEAYRAQLDEDRGRNREEVVSTIRRLVDLYDSSSKPDKAEVFRKALADLPAI